MSTVLNQHVIDEKFIERLRKAGTLQSLKHRDAFAMNVLLSQGKLGEFFDKDGKFQIASEAPLPTSKKKTKKLTKKAQQNKRGKSLRKSTPYVLIPQVLGAHPEGLEAHRAYHEVIQLSGRVLDSVRRVFLLYVQFGAITAEEVKEGKTTRRIYRLVPGADLEGARDYANDKRASKKKRNRIAT